MAGAIILKTKAEIHHKRVTLRFKSGLGKLKSARSAKPADGFEVNTDPANEFVNQFAAVMHEAGEKLNRKYLRVARVSKDSFSRFILKSGSFHSSFFKDADRNDITKAQALVNQAWEDPSKNESLLLAVLELHFYGTTVYQALEEYLDLLSTERTKHLDNMTALRAHIVRQMHLAGNHDGCGAACGKMAPALLNQKCEEIAQMIRAEYEAMQRAQESIRQSIQQSQAFTRQRQYEDRRQLLSSLGSEGVPAKDLKLRAKHLRRMDRKLAANQADYAAADAQFKAAGNLISGYQSSISKVAASNTEVTGEGYFDHRLVSAGWHRTTINSSELGSAMSAFKAEDRDLIRGGLELATGEVSAASVLAYGVDQAGNAAGNAVSEAVTVAGGAASVGTGAVVGMAIDTIRDLYEGRQLVRRLHVGGKASREVWDKLKTSGLDAALADLKAVGLNRDKLPAIGQRIKHYVDKMADIEKQMQKVQRQAPYASIFVKDFYDNSLFKSCQDAIEAWHACCYKDKQYAKLETSALAFLGILKTMQKNLEGASHGAVVKADVLFTKAGPASQPSYYDQL